MAVCDKLCAMRRSLCLLLIGAAGFGVAGGLLWSRNQATPPPPAHEKPQPLTAAELSAIPLVPPRTGKSVKKVLFDGKTLNNWDGSSKWWSVEDGEIVGRSTGRIGTSFLYTKDNYTDFRLTLSSKMVESENHAGVAFWGTVVPDEKDPTNKWGTRGPLVMFPKPEMWDYSLAKYIRVFYRTTEKVTSQHEWIKIEILAQGNRIRAAFNGVDVMEWREADPSRVIAGPLGIQLHGYNGQQEVRYKDIVVETFPKEDRLITVKR